MKTKALSKLISQGSVLEQVWMMRIILKDLKIGLGHETLFKHLDEKALDVYNSTSSLREVCNYLQNPRNSRYLTSFFQLFHPIKPMLAGRMTLKQIYSTFDGVEVLIETKYDGERIQCHKERDEVKFFTRNAIDYTYLYGKKLTKFILESVNAKSCILDGEVIVWDKVNNKIAPFGENKTIANSDESEKQICFMIFDIIYLISPRGEEYTLNQATLFERKQILSKIVNPIPNRIEIVNYIESNNVDMILKQFSDSVNRGEEGLIVKKKDSLYKIDERGSDWIKMKSDYLDTIIDTMDLIILGGYYGEGRRRIGINNNITNNQNWNDCITVFLLGVVKHLDLDNPKNSVILPICKVGTGYSMQDLEIIQTKLKPYWKKYEDGCFIYNNNFWKPAIGEKPDVVISDPSKSIIFELKASEIVYSDSFPAKMTFRFPRVSRIRYDKNWNECMTLDEVSKFYSDNQHNLLVDPKKITTKDLGFKKDNSKVKKVGKFSKIIETYRDTNTSNIVQNSSLFNDCEFLVLKLHDEQSNNMMQKVNLEMLIVENGGRKIQNYMKSTTHVIANIIDIKVKSILNSKDINIYNQKWVYDCIKNKKIIKISPLYLLKANKQTQNKFDEEYDKYNDSYFENVDINLLKEIMNQMKIENCEGNQKTIADNKVSKVNVNNKINKVDNLFDDIFEDNDLDNSNINTTINDLDNNYSNNVLKLDVNNTNSEIKKKFKLTFPDIEL